VTKWAKVLPQARFISTLIGISLDGVEIT
jgi:hypothetical protein